MDVDLRSKSIEMKRSGIEMCFSKNKFFGKYEVDHLCEVLKV